MPSAPAPRLASSGCSASPLPSPSATRTAFFSSSPAFASCASAGGNTGIGGTSTTPSSPGDSASPTTAGNGVTCGFSKVKELVFNASANRLISTASTMHCWPCARRAANSASVMSPDGGSSGTDSVNRLSRSTSATHGRPRVCKTSKPDISGCGAQDMETCNKAARNSALSRLSCAICCKRSSLASEDSDLLPGKAAMASWLPPRTPAAVSEGSLDSALSASASSPEAGGDKISAGTAAGGSSTTAGSSTVGPGFTTVRPAFSANRLATKPSGSAGRSRIKCCKTSCNSPSTRCSCTYWSVSFRTSSRFSARGWQS
mmetsp:Transcript_58126/g.168454  ORF Transcript_58126/g.168454 Transcript_58126/m.168454 type:complete len:316 (-) Transcript_58126:423-1370(-)